MQLEDVQTTRSTDIRQYVVISVDNLYSIWILSDMCSFPANQLI